MAHRIDGSALAEALTARVAADVQALAEAGIEPGLAVILVGEHPASQIYVTRKLAESKRVGIRSFEYRLHESTSQGEVLRLIEALNNDPEVHGILVQLPLPSRIDASKVMDSILPAKDVDGFHPVNVGRLSTGGADLVPCTPLGCMLVLDTVIDDYRGLKATVIGKSNVVGKPVALMLLERECTVTITHIHTRNLPDIVRQADIVVVAAGSPRLVRGDWVKSGAIVIDVGINRVATPAGKTVIVGDAAFDELDHAAAITPVPGGIGPMTIACLLGNTVKAARIASADRRGNTSAPPWRPAGFPRMTT